MCRALPIGCAAHPRHRERRGDPAQLPARTPQVSTLRVSISVCIACAEPVPLETWIERVLVADSSVAASPSVGPRVLYICWFMSSPPHGERLHLEAFTGDEAEAGENPADAEDLVKTSTRPHLDAVDTSADTVLRAEGRGPPGCRATFRSSLASRHPMGPATSPSEGITASCGSLADAGPAALKDDRREIGFRRCWLCRKVEELQTKDCLKRQTFLRATRLSAWLT